MKRHLKLIAMPFLVVGVILGLLEVVPVFAKVDQDLTGNQPIVYQFNEPVQSDVTLAEITGADETWDRTDSMNGLGAELAYVFELDAKGQPVKMLTDDEKLEIGKSYEAYINFYNDSEVDVVRAFDIKLALNQTRGELEIATALRGSEHSFCPEKVDFKLVTDETRMPKLAVDGDYRIAFKDAELKLRWDNVEHAACTANGDELRSFTLNGEAQLNETSMQIMAVKFGLQ